MALVGTLDWARPSSVVPIFRPGERVGQVSPERLLFTAHSARSTKEKWNLPLKASREGVQHNRDDAAQSLSCQTTVVDTPVILSYKKEDALKNLCDVKYMWCSFMKNDCKCAKTSDGIFLSYCGAYNYTSRQCR